MKERKDAGNEVGKRWEKDAGEEGKGRMHEKRERDGGRDRGQEEGKKEGRASRGGKKGRNEGRGKGHERGRRHTRKAWNKGGRTAVSVVAVVFSLPLRRGRVKRAFSLGAVLLLVVDDLLEYVEQDVLGAALPEG